MKHFVTMLRLALRNTRRNGRRTLLTAATLTIGTALTTVTLALLSGIFGQMIDTWGDQNGHIRIVDKDFLEKEALQPLYENLAEVEPVLTSVRAVPGVVAAEPRIMAGVVLASGEEIGEDVALLVGAEESYYRHRLRGAEKLVAGKWLGNGKDEVVLGRKIATQIDAKVGDKILVMGQTQYGSMSPISAQVVGVVAGDSLIDNQAFVTLKTAQWLVDLSGGALEVLVYAESNDPSVVGPVAEQVAGSVDTGNLAVQSWFEREIWATTVPMVEAIQLAISLTLLFVMVLAIFNTMTMSVMERTREIGVMRAMGQTRLGAVWLFLVESLVIGLLGGGVGVFLGGLGARYLEVTGITFSEDLINETAGAYPMTSTLYADLTPDAVLTALVVGLLTAMLGALLPALRAASVQPTEAMRARR
jgi:putative ABC transport system permease protein